MNKKISKGEKVYPGRLGCSQARVWPICGFRFTNKKVQKCNFWGWYIKDNLKWVGVAFLKKINFVSEKVNKQLKYTLNGASPYVPGGLESSYFTWMSIFTSRSSWDPFWGCRGCLKSRGRSRLLEAIRGRGQIWHPETRGSHLSTIYGGLGGPRSLERPRAASNFKSGRTASRLVSRW